MDNIRICTVITGKTLDEFIGNLEKIQKIADFIELRVDHIHNLSIGNLDTIREKTTKQAIFTCRKKDEGGLYTGSEEERKKIIERANELKFDYIDVELSAADRMEIARINNAKIIISFHDFQKTPSVQELMNVKHKMKKYKTIMKFATMVNSDDDNTSLIKFLLDKQIDEDLAVIGMGEKGKVTRIFGPLLGSYLTFASTDFSQSAPGQLTVDQLKQIYNLLQ